MKKPIIFILDKGQVYQSKKDLDNGAIQLNSGMRNGVKVIMKEGAQDYRLIVMSSDMDGNNPQSTSVTMDNITEPVKVQKYKNLSFLLADGSDATSYTFEIELVSL